MWRFISEKIREYDNSFISDNNHKVKFNEFFKLAEECGSELRKKLKYKTKCAILCKSNYHTALALLSCWCADLVPIPMSLNYGEEHCLNIIKGTEPQIMIIDDISLGERYNINFFNLLTNQFSGEIEVNYEEENKILEDISLIMNTSGTTGYPKGVMIFKEGLIQNIVAIDDYFDISSNDTILIARPLYHCAVMTGEFLISLYKGVSIHFLDATFNPIEIIKNIEKYSITVMCSTPTMFQHISTFCKRTQKKDILKVIAISGECLTKEIAYNIRQEFPNAKIYNVYGLTEASPRVSYLDYRLFDSMPESVGKGLNNTNIKICDDDGINKLTFEHGMVWIKSNSIMKGYYNNEYLSTKKIVNGWLVTGDIGYLDEQGFLYILSRSDDMIIKAGMNIYPKEIENILIKLVMIKEVVAYRVNDNGGQVIGLDVVLEKEYENLTIKELSLSITSVLPSYLLPKYINIVDNLKRNASGKVVRN